MTLEEFYKLLGERDVIIYQLQRTIVELQEKLKAQETKESAK